MPRIVRSEIINPKLLAPEQRAALTAALYAVHCEIFDGVEPAAFARYVVESPAELTSIQVHRNEHDAIVGYFALHVFEREFNGEPVAIFRAEAGSLRAYRGRNVNAPLGLQLGLRYMLQHPGRRVYYLGSLVHPSSYSAFLKFFGDVWPRASAPTPPALLSLMDDLATSFGLERVVPHNPLLRHVGWRTRETEAERAYWAQCDKPAGRFFVDANPGYQQGHGLVTMVQLSFGSLLHMARTLGRAQVRKPMQLAYRLMRQTPLGARLVRPRIMAYLREALLFAHLPAATLQTLAAAATLSKHAAGRHLFRHGEPGHDLLLLVRGAAYALATEADGTERIIDQLSSGAAFGEMAVLTGEHRTATVRTASSCTVLRIPRRALLPVLAADAQLHRSLWLHFAARRLDELVHHLGSYEHLGQPERRQWLAQGTLHELHPADELTLEASQCLLTLTGVVELGEAAGVRLVQGAAWLELTAALQLTARSAAKVMVLPAVAALAQA
ncbi:cyclic nucleotide-binding domain-containing protein [Hymenobacter oligotrophus]|uniref:Cyclic nucleotide-binding domain-containing protein n=1 Tax=Hymenobacter oligotrophus TaxID=2319843 RepID=A0A3B7R416_9BACT|nr:cyclic nucleotide-binding domain-containing protein [Hymenobacter oligotrophus]